jgi:hypothetical protein
MREHHNAVWAAACPEDGRLAGIVTSSLDKTTLMGEPFEGHQGITEGKVSVQYIQTTSELPAGEWIKYCH